MNRKPEQTNCNINKITALKPGNVPSAHRLTGMKSISSIAPTVQQKGCEDDCCSAPQETASTAGECCSIGTRDISSVALSETAEPLNYRVGGWIVRLARPRLYVG